VTSERLEAPGIVGISNSSGEMLLPLARARQHLEQNANGNKQWVNIHEHHLASFQISNLHIRGVPKIKVMGELFWEIKG